MAIDYVSLFGLGTYTIALFMGTYYCMIADPSKSKLSHLLKIVLPHKIKSVVRSIAGERVVTLLEWLSTRFLAILYMIVVFGSWMCIFIGTYPWIDLYVSEGRIASYHKYLGYLVFLACIGSWRMASTVSPGIITEDTLEQFENYPYDGILFIKNRICPTTNLRKLARSKFDRFTHVHVSKFDHFCGWLHNAIGEQNYRWFLLFLLIHVGMCAYGTCILGNLFLLEVERHELWSQTFFNRNTGEEFAATYYVVFHYLFQRHKMQSGLFLLLAAMTIVLVGFLSYHVWIASRGMTTNETVKWTQVRKWYRIELRRYQQAVNNNNANNGSVVGSSSGTKDDDDEDNTVHPGPEPKNIYNLGLVENWKDIFFPRSLRSEAIKRVKRVPTTITPSTANTTTVNTNKPKAS
eukprot:CAMPEP_0194205680 /NCGR_PEP_ID=MMETSP0156-20130528/4898_1 /TAXON_ID=33649 /ORGANISM="Thalassionema nitzschioides, Strain L26-B" /LENGTH=405 /DNA_ID=CAMNT_0038932019 /DNA_START=16 /DNA_END=1233 /DNA_ORIENTATION=-